MCGIAGIHIKNQKAIKKHDGVELMVNMLLEGIENRGREATGMVAVTDSGLTVLDKKAVCATDFIQQRKSVPKKVRTVLLHTRLATQGPNENHLNLHPVAHESCFLTHNGVLSNDYELFEEHGLQRTAEVDTEIIPAMLNFKGWDNVKEALEAIRGSFAIAAIDPVKQPGKLLLARGSSSPLSVYHTENFIVWASMGFVIRDAWAKVLGTPPDWKKIDTFKEGQILLVDGSEVTTDEFKVAERRPFKRTTTTTTVYGGTASTESGTRRDTVISTSRGVVKFRQKDITKIREAGHGEAVTWDQNNSKEWLLERTKGRIIWNRCPSCRALVLDDDFRYLKDEGLVCLDCYNFEHRNLVFSIKKELKEEIEKWCEKEVQAHTEALVSVAAQVEMSEDAVEYLIFRVSPAYVKNNPDVKKASEALDELYQGELQTAFDNMLDEDTAAEAKKAADREKDEPDKTRVQCAVCDKFHRKGEKCRWCEHTERLQVCWCGKPATVLLGRMAGFCQEHYDRCNEKDCKFGPHVNGKRVDGPGIANHILTSGKRVCHFHARGVKGAWSDTKVKEVGFVVSELSGAKEPGGL